MVVTQPLTSYSSLTATVIPSSARGIPIRVALLRLASGLLGLIEMLEGNAVDLVVERFDPFDLGFEHIHGRQLAFVEADKHFASRQIGGIICRIPTRRLSREHGGGGQLTGSQEKPTAVDHVRRCFAQPPLRVPPACHRGKIKTASFSS